jgi:hypothetical protein
MVEVTGKGDVGRYFDQLPQQVRDKLLRGAARKMAEVVAEEMRLRVTSDTVRAAITVETRLVGTQIISRATIKKGSGKSANWARTLANWLEYGTSAHFISVDVSQRRGLSVRKVNDKVKDGSLVIGNQFVGTTVHHPGARPHPFMRVSMDTKGDDARAAGQAYILSKISGGRIVADNDAGNEAAAA